MERQEQEQPWKGICSESCWQAKLPRCRCKCQGLHHGKGRHSSQEQGDPVLSPSQAAPFERMITNVKCDCGASLKGQPIHCYPHDGGWKVEGMKGLQWLYKVCPECDYQWALWKLGVPRDFDPIAGK